MHHELLSTMARVLALLQHPSRLTCPHTLLHRRCAFFAHRQDLQLPLVFRAQVRYEATDPILLVDNAISLLQIRPGGVCFTVLDVLRGGAFTRAVQGGGLLGRFARVRASRNNWLVPSMSCIEHMHANRVSNYVFRARAR